MKIQKFLIIAVFVCSYGFSQDKNTTVADNYFSTFQYVAAIDEYTKLAEGKHATPYIFTQLADSYFNVYNTEKAAQWYEKALETQAFSNPELYYRYAQTLKSQGKYAEANKQMDEFSKLLPNDSRAVEHLANPNYIPSLESENKEYVVKKIDFKEKGMADFGGVISNDNLLYFVSIRKNGNRTDKWNDQPYLDIYKSERRPNGTFTEPEPIEDLNTPFHDGPVTISTDGNTMYFARDSHSEGQYQKKNGNVKIGQQGLYKATRSGGKWSNVTALPFNSIDYTVTHPALSKDGKTLYFSSNMPGGIGESDIWKVEIKANGYGTPVNMGNKINTPGKENFPFVTESNILYYASTGKQGMGGLDIYRVNLAVDELPKNMGKPINTAKDDFAFTYNTKLKQGVLSSNRNGEDALYSVNPLCSANVVVTVTNKKTKQPMGNVAVAIKDFKGNTITTQNTDKEGKVNYDIECNSNYTLEASSLNYESKQQIVKVKEGEEKITMVLEPTEITITDTEIILKNIYFEFDKSNITAQGANELDKLVKVMKENPAMVVLVKSHTDSKGKADYNLKLSEQRAQATVQYLLSKGITKDRISGQGFGNTEPKINCTSCTEEQHAENRRSEFIIVKK